MTLWAIEFERAASRDLERLDSVAAKRILTFLQRRLANLEDPASLAKSLAGPMQGILRWRVGDYRILGRLETGRLVIVVVEVGHRRQVYR